MHYLALNIKTVTMLLRVKKKIKKKKDQTFVLLLFLQDPYAEAVKQTV